jgi:hypothetical protein
MEVDVPDELAEKWDLKDQSIYKKRKQS